MSVVVLLSPHHERGYVIRTVVTRYIMLLVIYQAAVSAGQHGGIRWREEVYERMLRFTLLLSWRIAERFIRD